MAKLTKTYLYDICVGSFYYFQIYKITDAAHNVYYVGSPVTHGITKIADTEQELKAMLEAQVKPLNDFLAKTR